VKKVSLFEIKEVDKKYYEQRLKDYLPDSIFDVHTHVYLPQVRLEGEKRTVTWPSLVADSNPIEDLIETGKLMFPGKNYKALIFGTPTIGADLSKENGYVAKAAKQADMPSLMLVHPQMSAQEVEKGLVEGGFKGIKVYLSYAPMYIPVPEIRIFDFLTHEHLEVCDKLGLAVMLHISRNARLRDPVNIAQMIEIEETYKNIDLIIAHVGRAYCNHDVGDAFEKLSKTKKMRFDFSANTNDWVFEQLIKAVGPERILFGSDLPIARMRMRRIEEDGVYKNVVQRGMYGDVSDDKNMKEVDSPEADELSFFMYEIMDNFRKASQRTGLSAADVEKVFWGNGAGLFGVGK
jgi:predicted TIM-barrel fold metal-dependent hydrolase